MIRRGGFVVSRAAKSATCPLLSPIDVELVFRTIQPSVGATPCVLTCAETTHNARVFNVRPVTLTIDVVPLHAVLLVRCAFAVLHVVDSDQVAAAGQTPTESEVAAAT
jgi:hypothetical protein